MLASRITARSYIRVIAMIRTAYPTKALAFGAYSRPSTAPHVTPIWRISARHPESLCRACVPQPERSGGASECDRYRLLHAHRRLDMARWL